MKLKLALLSLAILFGSSLFAQKNTIQVKGKVVDGNSNKALEYATIAILKPADNSLIAGGITDGNGDFTLKIPAEKFYLEVSYLGYNKLLLNDIEITGPIVDLQSIGVKPDEEVLDEVTVTAQKSRTTFELDKRVFNVGADLTSAGGSALDVLNNVPSVDVDIEGVVSLRGNSNIQILVNGKPSVMVTGNTLGTISADMIEKVEVITNPSAKYDAEGTTGIINIVLKKEDRKGLNGAVTLNIGSRNNHSLGLSLNKRTEKFNLFSQLGVGTRRFISTADGATIDRSITNPESLYITSDDEKNEEFYNIVLGTDYHINSTNVLTLSGHFAYEFEDEFSSTAYEIFDEQNSLISSSLRDEVTEATNPKYQYDLSYKKTFEGNKDRSLTAHAIGSSFAKDKFSDFAEEYTVGLQDDIVQDVHNDMAQVEYSFQTDYVHPFSENSELETGLKYVISDISNDNELVEFENGQWVTDNELTDVFEFDQKVTAAYATYGRELEKFGVKFGLRVENTQLDMLLQGDNIRNDQNYTNAFPTLHTSYKVTDAFSLQAGYSRRIHRPRMWDFNPFPSLKDNLNRRIGNPNLLPEFTDAYEVNAIQTWDIASLSAAVFHHRTDGVIDRIVAVDGNSSLTSLVNLGQSRNTGLEVNIDFQPVKWLNILVDGNWQSFNRLGVLEGNAFDFTNSRWSADFTKKIKLPYNIDIEIRANYRSRVEGVQGITKAYVYSDLGIKKKFMKGRAVVNFGIRDAFKSRKYITEVDRESFYRYNERLRNAQQMVLGFSYGFGKGDAMEFSGYKQF
ncbi:MAG: TonB-dependent receptor [Cyclobacteriaceae bacterium]